jgi:VCBS repeat protein
VSYHSNVIRFRVAIIAAMLLAFARPSAADVPPGAVIRVDRVIDLASFSRTIASRYDIVVHRAVTADIDRDGDLDVLTASDHGFDVWVNDGAGRLTSQPQRPHVPMAAGAPDDRWRESDSHQETSIQTHVPSVKAPANRSPAPPAARTGRVSPVDPGLDRHAARGIRVPRAPPLA